MRDDMNKGKTLDQKTSSNDPRNVKSGQPGQQGHQADQRPGQGSNQSGHQADQRPGQGSNQSGHQAKPSQAGSFGNKFDPKNPDSQKIGKDTRPQSPNTPRGR